MVTGPHHSTDPLGTSRMDIQNRHRADRPSASFYALCADRWPALLFSSRTEVSTALEDRAVAYPLFAGKSCAILGLALCLFLLKNRSRISGLAKTLCIGFLGMFFLSAAVWYNPIANPRTQTIALGILIVIAVLRFPRPFQRPALLSACGLETFFAMGSLKAIAAGGSFSFADIQQLRSYLFRVDFDSYQIINDSAKYVALKGYFLFFEYYFCGPLFCSSRHMANKAPRHKLGHHGSARIPVHQRQLSSSRRVLRRGGAPGRCRSGFSHRSRHCYA